jgi:hypothetical protein
MALGNANTTAQARGKNVALKVKKEKDRVAAKKVAGGFGGKKGGKK